MPKNHNKGAMTYHPIFFSQFFDSYLLNFLSSKWKKTPSSWSKKVCFRSLPVEKKYQPKLIFCKAFSASNFSMYFLYQGSVKSTFSCVRLAETANWAESGKHQFWAKPSEILNLRSSTTPETVAFTPPWYQTWWSP